MRKKKIQKRDDELLLFQQVRCAGFIAKERHFRNPVNYDEQTRTFTVTQGSVTKRGLSEASVTRTYYSLREAPFTGVYVGTKTVIVKADIDVSVDADGINHYYKRPTKVVNCGIVYFASNRKHLVPLEYLNVR